MERDDVLALLDVQRKNFNDVIERMGKEMKMCLKDANQEISEVTRSLEFSQAEVADLEKKVDEVSKANRSLNSHVSILANENEELRKQIEELKNRTDYMDDQHRRPNLRFSGVPEIKDENWEQSFKKIDTILKEKFAMNTKLEKVQRIGKPSTQRPRDLIVKFSMCNDRDAVLRNRKVLKGTIGNLRPD